LILQTVAVRWHSFRSSLAIDDSAFVTIGDNVAIGTNVQFITTNHSTDVAERLQGCMYARSITVSSACWIGARVTLLPGATVGYGCTIGAGAVVGGNIPEYSVAVGVPARVVKRVFPTLPASVPAVMPEIGESQFSQDEKGDVE
jgi:acetyltransferase-like isoleucine patch superfamily enzyme